MRGVQRDSEEWKRVWAALGAALEANPLPTEDGEADICEIGDFMLMGLDNNGVAHFKNEMTRNYLLVAQDGVMTIPIGGPFAGGFFGCSER